MEKFWNITLELLKGFGVSLEIFGMTLLFALPLGLVFALLSMTKWKPLKAVMRTFIWIIRGTPLMLQIIIVFYGPALMFKMTVPDRIFAVLVAFVINYACYFSEIYRAGIEGISNGQFEAGQVLGLSKMQIFFKVILVQAIKRIIPPMSNEIITLVKDTSLARVIMVAEILKVAEDQMAKGLIWPLFYTAIYYLIFVGVLTVLLSWLEKKFNWFKV
jgi:polar amino acid transport system permease protein